MDVEDELTSQLAEQQEALAGVQAALEAAGGDSEELQQMAEALIAGIAELEAALLEVTRSRLLASMEQGNGVPAGAAVALGPPAGLMPPGTRCRFRGDDGRWYGGVVVELLPPAPPPAGPDTAGGGAPDEHQRQQQDPQEEEGMAAGGARWMAHVAFDMPTHRWMLGGSKVPASSLRRPRRPPDPTTAEPPVPPGAFAVGDVVHVRPSALRRGGAGQQGAEEEEGRDRQAVWPTAHVVLVDERASVATVELAQGNKARLRVALRHLTLTAAAGCSDLDSSGSEEEEEEEEEEEGEEGGAGRGGAGPRRRWRGHGAAGGEGRGSGLDVLGHARRALEAGIHKETVHFARWEAHTRGVASKLLAKMGYKPGGGLGTSGRGAAAPVQVRLFPERSGLGSVAGIVPQGHGVGGEGGEGPGGARAGGGWAEEGEGEGAEDDGDADGGAYGRKRKGRRRRGGERSRRKRAAAAARERREERAGEAHDRQARRGEEPGLFGFINNQLGDQSLAAQRIREVETALLRQDRVRPEEGGAGPSGRGGGGGGAAKPDSRQRLINLHNQAQQCKEKVAHFQAMLRRNQGNAPLAVQISANIRNATAELAAVEKEQARMSGALRAADQQKGAFTSKKF